jgi:hypothetical protein
MANGLSKRAFLHGYLEGTSVDVLDKDTGALLFKGTLTKAGRFMGVNPNTAHSALKHKCVCQKKYRITYSSEK